MAIAAHKITLSSSRDIPFNKLVLAQSNVRRVKAGISIEELAEDIAQRTLLQSLSVRPVRDLEGEETGMFEIPAGGRRYRALELLVKQKRLARTALVPCVVREGGMAEEDSLAENIQRVALHPLDQFRAFQALSIKGLDVEEIAARFFVNASEVKRRLRLASVSPALLEVYAQDGMTLEQLMAFTVTADHARQEQIWETVGRGHNKEPYYIRRLLTEGAVRAADRRAQFVGLDAYTDAGGEITRDLFQHDDGGWLQDPALLDRLVTDKLKAEAETLAAEGWKWLEVAIDLPYGHEYGLRRLTGEMANLSDEEQAALFALQAEYDALTARHIDADELTEDVDARFAELEAEIEALQDRPVRFDPAEIAHAGAFVSLGSEGRLHIERGFVRPADEPVVGTVGSDQDANETGMPDCGAAETPSVQRAVITLGGEPVAQDEEEDEVCKPLPERLLIELTAHRTLALRDAVANNPHVALTALLHKLAQDTFPRGAASGASLQASIRHVFFPAQGDDLKISASAKAIAQRQKDWLADLPQDDDALWDWLDDLDDASRLALLAHCISFGVNALYEKPNPFSGSGVSQHGLDRRLAEADRLARATGLDMVTSGWTPTVENYLGRVTKPRILQAVREGAGERAAQLIDHMKKGDMAKEAERLLADTGWLPEPLRGAPVEQPLDLQGEGEADSDALPDFLAEDEDEAVEDDDPQRTAAE